jgi:hypothetical protein
MVRAGAGSASAADLLHSRATPTNPPPHVAGERLTLALFLSHRWPVGVTAIGTCMLVDVVQYSTMGWFAGVVCGRSFAFPLWSYNMETVQVVPEQNVVNVVRLTQPPALVTAMSLVVPSDARRTWKRFPLYAA